MQLLKELDVYNLSEEISDMIWLDFDQWSLKVQHSIGNQIIRSSDSIAANLAEGYGRYTIKDRLKFFQYARGSFEETECWLRKLTRRKIINEERLDDYSKIINILGPKLNKFISNSRKQITNN